MRDHQTARRNAKKEQERAEGSGVWTSLDILHNNFGSDVGFSQGTYTWVLSVKCCIALRNVMLHYVTSSSRRREIGELVYTRNRKRTRIYTRSVCFVTTVGGLLSAKIRGSTKSAKRGAPNNRDSRSRSRAVYIYC